MRKTFFVELYKQMQRDHTIWAITGDLGYGGFDKIRDDFPNRFINCGAAEQAMMGIAVGLALKGKIPFVYSITPFLLCRPYETIRNYIDHEKINVKLIGSGRDDDYKHDGFSHYGGDDRDILDNFPNIEGIWPTSKEDVPKVVNYAAKIPDPVYINLSR